MFKKRLFSTIWSVLLNSALGEICELPDSDVCSIVQMNAVSPAADQLVDFRACREESIGTLTTNSGRSLTEKEASESLNIDLLLNHRLIPDLTKLVRKDNLMRIVHANGGEAFGHFKVTHNRRDIIDLGPLRRVGKKIPAAVRFSSTLGFVGSADTVRDNRGFAVKLYTDEGNWDLIGLSIPVFPINNPIYFPDLIHSERKNPQTFTLDENMFWDFVINKPESINFVLRLFSDIGIPCSFENIPGYPIHTFCTCNKNGKVSFVRFRIEPNAGERGLSSADGVRIQGEDPDYFIGSLYDQIAKGKYPCWTVFIQALTEKQIMKASFDAFDNTLDFNETTIEPLPLGELCLDRNPVNFQTDIESLAFCVLNQPPGIECVDPMCRVRGLMYLDAHNYRLGSNADKIPVNLPHRKVLNYMRGGSQPLGDNGENSPNYYKNSFFGPEPTAKPKCEECKKFSRKFVFSTEPNNFQQAAAFFNDLSKEEQERVMKNIAARLVLVTADDVREKSLQLFTKVDPKLGAGITALVAACPAVKPSSD